MGNAVSAQASRLRALAAGLVCAVGAMAAHGLSGGGAPGPMALVALPLSVLLTMLVVRRHHDAAALGAAALLSQGLWHVLLMAAPAPAAESGPVDLTTGGLRMLVAHLLITVLTVAICRGLDRAIVGLLTDWVLRRVAPLVAGPVPTRRRPRVVARTTYRHVAVAHWAAASGQLRGPPAPSVLLTPA